jgi:cobalt-zinc-cadmium efflux system membrane fusion protein
MTIRKLVTAALLGMAVLALGACNRSTSDTSEHAKAEAAKNEEHKGIELSPEEQKTAGVEVAVLEPQTLVDRLVLTATIRANQDRIAHVAPRVPARIVKVSANLGQAVKKGEKLALLDSIELGEAHSAHRQAHTQFALAKADFERAQRLKNEDIIPEKDYLRARAEYEKARASLRAAEDKLRLLDVPHDTGERAESTFPLSAPFAGTVIEKDAVLGELAQPDKSIFTVADLSTLWIEANVFEKDLSRIRIGVPAIVTVNGYPGEQFKGRLTYLSSTLDKETRTVQARIEVPNPDGRLKPQMFATAAIDTQSSTQALALPQDAVPLVNGQPTAFVRENGRFEARPVELGEAVGERVVVKSGLKAGEQAVVRGAYALKARLLKSQIGDSH